MEGLPCGVELSEGSGVLLMQALPLGETEGAPLSLA